MLNSNANKPPSHRVREGKLVIWGRGQWSLDWTGIEGWGDPPISDVTPCFYTILAERVMSH